MNKLNDLRVTVHFDDEGNLEISGLRNGETTDANNCFTALIAGLAMMAEQYGVSRDEVFDLLHTAWNSKSDLTRVV